MKKLIVICYVASLLCECMRETPVQFQENNKNEIIEKEAKNINKAPVEPSPDTILFFVKKQVERGLRVPGTPAHSITAQWIKNCLHTYGMDTFIQKGFSKNIRGSIVPVHNIIGVRKGKSDRAVLLGAHWDSRPADLIEGDKSRFQGAIDGASGVATLLELSRISKNSDNQLTLIIVFFDAEDMGGGNQFTISQSNELSGWCIGSRYFCENFPPFLIKYEIIYAIVVDMVGAPSPVFPLEETSLNNAPALTSKIISIANELGLSPPFITQKIGTIIDDHIPLTYTCKIPAALIINYEPENRHFGFFHHNENDNIENFSPVGCIATVKVLYALITEPEKSGYTF